MKTQNSSNWPMDETVEMKEIAPQSLDFFADAPLIDIVSELYPKAESIHLKFMGERVTDDYKELITTQVSRAVRVVGGVACLVGLYYYQKSRPRTSGLVVRPVGKCEFLDFWICMIIAYKMYMSECIDMSTFWGEIPSSLLNSSVRDMCSRELQILQLFRWKMAVSARDLEDFIGIPRSNTRKSSPVTIKFYE
jgi:hypothetical protein